KNLMAKAANQIRDLGHTAELNADFDSWWGSVVAVLQGAVLGVAAEPEPEPEDVGSSDPKHLYMLVENVSYDVEDTESYFSFSFAFKHRMLSITDKDNDTMDLKERGRVTPDWPLRENLLINSPLPEFLG
ncbi:hypothetical protein PIB30_114265, partial [Stylosanthes scabra]|nr:hypothetical protein [Stylosanthes scabra]